MIRFFIFFLIFYPLVGHSQIIPFTEETIPIINGKVVFGVKFSSDLNKEELHKRTYSYLNSELNPYSGLFYVDNVDTTISQVIDYIKIEESAIQTFGMYMTYIVAFEYIDGVCDMVIQDINFMEKTYFEAQEVADRKLRMPSYSGKDIMIDGMFSMILIKKVSERITEASLRRINEIINHLDASLSKK